MLTVITPAERTRLTTVKTAQAHLQIDGDPDEFYLGELIDAASAIVVGWCCRSFARETVRQTFRGTLGDCLVLERLPVATDVTVSVDGRAIEAEAFEIEPGTGLLYALSGFRRCAWQGSFASVTYTGGYFLPGAQNRNLPRDVEQACLVTIGALHAARGRDPLLRSESTEDVGSASWLDPRAGMEALPPQAAGMLAPYRAWRAG
ncbi:hypothetical protein [Pseudoroseomonas cervicalis]|uniref:hypothetical protein n=1 Tax=Teichococcus cervicalis TaxID=204525 RepID=UPI0027814282|nr:hypothetical protein [Pseudoroseomonas cervicalis]MDQ1081442.1 hypothetical protein [Pseudoroseomonas cervicalis]